jgi:hypothetical protein
MQTLAFSVFRILLFNNRVNDILKYDLEGNVMYYISYKIVAQTIIMAADYVLQWYNEIIFL